MNAHRHASENDELLARLDARFRRPLMSFFLRRVSNRAEAEDLTQDVFARIVAVDHVGIDDTDAFVFRVASNLLRDRARKSATRAMAQLAEVDDHLLSSLTREFLDECTPERVVVARAEIGEVLKALEELGQRTKDIYVLFRLEAMKQRQIAALYGLSVGTIEKEVARAALHLSLRFGSE